MYTYKIKQVIRVIDGDTIVISIDLGFDVSIIQTIRVNGIDAPENRTTDKQEKVYGIAAKAYVEKWLENKDLIIKTYKDDKYGRILGDITCDKTKENLSELMIAAGHAKVYILK